MYTVAFHSYRGGVGRTTTLANVAVELACRGRKVLVVDCHLEAPGLPAFDLFRRAERHPGVVEFLAEYVRANRAPAVEDYLYQAAPVGAREGEIWMMPAGRCDADYWSALARLDWLELFDFHEGYLLFKNLKKQWQDLLAPDYVLIDTPPGICTTAEVCTRLLADGVAMLFTPDKAGPLSDQTAIDIEGLQNACLGIVADKDESGRPRGDLYLVAVKVPQPQPDTEEEQGTSHWSRYWALESEELGIVDLAATVPHAPSLLSDRRLLVREKPRSLLARQYRRLVNEIVVGNCTQDRDGARAFLKDLQRNPARAIDAGPDDPWSGHRAARLNGIVNRFTDLKDAEVLAQAADCFFRAGSDLRALEVLNEAIELRRRSPDLLWQRISYNRRRNLRQPVVGDLFALLDLRIADPQAEQERAQRLALFRERARKLGAAGRPLEPSIPHELDTRPLEMADKLSEDVPGGDRYVVSAVRLLQQLAPERIDEVRRHAAVQQLSAEDQERLFSDQPPPPARSEGDAYDLMCSRDWPRVIALLEPSASDPTMSKVDAFHLAMACWGAGEHAKAVAYCGLAVDKFLAAWEAREFSGWEEFQMVSLMCWKEGMIDEARELLDYIEEANPPEGTTFYSYWRYRTVSWDEFRQDLNNQRQTMRHAKDQDDVRPLILEPEARRVSRQAP